MQKNKNIVVFDSGIGGLTVLKKLYKKLPQENYIYFADTGNVPYGIKSKEEIKHFIKESIKKLPQEEIKLLVIACNTATSAAVEEIRKESPYPVVGMEPAVKPAIENKKDKKILVTATTTTLREEKLNNLIQSFGVHKDIEKMALDELVLYAEKMNFSSNNVKNYLLEKLQNIDLTQYSNIVLGCTHFVHYKKTIEKIAKSKNPNITVIDGNEGTARHCMKILDSKSLCNDKGEGEIFYMRSGIKETDAERIKKMNQIINGEI